MSIGTAGDFSAGNIATQGAFTLDGAAASTGSVTLTGVTAGGNLTISMGAGLRFVITRVTLRMLVVILY